MIFVRLIWKLLGITKRMGWAHTQIGFFIITYQFTSKNTVVAGLIIWLSIVCLSLGLIELKNFKPQYNVQ